MSDVFELHRGNGPLLLSAPHVGTLLPDEIDARLTPPGRALVDTDWYADRLYPFAESLGASVLRARWSRYVVDLNRDPAGTVLYPGTRTTGFVPTETFEGEPLYAPGDEPESAETAARCRRYFEPYHDALHDELARLKAAHGQALLLDAHSIWGRLPLLFDGELPDINIGTNSGFSCDPKLTAAVAGAAAGAPYSVVVDGRFKGGYITRRYGAPAHRVEAIQIEINQRTYLADGSRTEWDEAKAARLSAVLRTMCEALLAAASAGRRA
ncbi:MAG TPA: N-formylglutamate deformylase [Candidatus Elarobacter sp.]|nr:N-formylglutamate deformylase [Candidatus Elarobacter sp.]